MCNYNKELFLLIPYYFWQYINKFAIFRQFYYTQLHKFGNNGHISATSRSVDDYAAVTLRIWPLRVVSGFRMEDVRIKTDRLR